tara:strand:+ start:1343 stop:1696 length:354 start_codon:yes stop_codon:yes gene_type:complete
MKNIGKIECEECGAANSDLHRLGHCYVNSEGKLEVLELLSECGWFCDVCETEVTVKRIYPFEEGDDYWTIEGDEVVHSCWDDLSEAQYHNTVKYFATEADAMNELRRIQKVGGTNDI